MGSTLSCSGLTVAKRETSSCARAWSLPSHSRDAEEKTDRMFWTMGGTLLGPGTWPGLGACSVQPVLEHSSLVHLPTTKLTLAWQDIPAFWTSGFQHDHYYPSSQKVFLCTSSVLDLCTPLSNFLPLSGVRRSFGLSSLMAANSQSHTFCLSVAFS